MKTYKIEDRINSKHTIGHIDMDTGREFFSCTVKHSSEHTC